MEEDFLNKGRNKQKFIKSKIDINNNDYIRETIEKKFSDPNKYFDLDEKVIIGKSFNNS
jgi:hypothetical protein